MIVRKRGGFNVAFLSVLITVLLLEGCTSGCARGIFGQLFHRYPSGLLRTVKQQIYLRRHNPLWPLDCFRLFHACDASGSFARDPNGYDYRVSIYFISPLYVLPVLKRVLILVGSSEEWVTYFAISDALEQNPSLEGSVELIIHENI